MSLHEKSHGRTRPAKLTDGDQCRYDMFKDVDEHLAARRGVAFTEKFVKGLPIGLKLPSGITIGESE